MNDTDLLVSCWLIPLPQCKKYYQTKHKELVDSEEALSKAGQAPATDKTEKVRSVYSATDKTEKVYSLYSLITVGCLTGYKVEVVASLAKKDLTPDMTR